MNNGTAVSTTFVLLGLVQIERFKYIYAALAFFLYLIIMFVCCLIVYVVWTEETLHEPMYIFICNLVFNGMFGSSSFLPRLIIALLSESRTIYFYDCLIQTFCLHSFAANELFTFTVMAHDRCLAISQPLRYPTLMNNSTAVKHVSLNWLVAFIVVLIPVVMTATLQVCGVNINNVFCENTSIIMLACGGAPINNIFGVVEALLINISCLLVIIYNYIRTFLVCLKFSREVYLKATRTLVTHLAAFSTFIISSFFLLLRYRINGGSISIMAHVLISVMGLVIPITLNPLIYGLRTEGLKLKIIQKFKKIIRSENFGKSH